MWQVYFLTICGNVALKQLLLFLGQLDPITGKSGPLSEPHKVSEEP